MKTALACHPLPQNDENRKLCRARSPADGSIPRSPDRPMAHDSLLPKFPGGESLMAGRANAATIRAEGLMVTRFGGGVKI
jgi:hypothetical protein